MFDVYTSMANRDSVPRPCACTTLKKASRLLGRVFDAALVPSRMNVTQLAVMRCIARRKGDPLARVAEELEMDRTSLYRAISPLARDGWIEIVSGLDGRSRSARVTSRGHRSLVKAGRYWGGVQTRIIDSFGRERWKVLVTELQRLGHCARAINGEKFPGSA